MSNVDFLNDLANSTEQTGPATSVDASETTAKTEGETGTTGEKAKYPNIVETREADADTSDLLTVTEFASRLTVRNVQRAIEQGKPEEATNGIVQPSAVYNAQKAARNPLPVVLVGDTAYVQAFEVSSEAWDARPTRGEGAGTTGGGKLADEDLLRLSWKATNEVDRLEKRLASVQANLEKANKRKAMRGRQLSERSFTWEQVEEWGAENDNGEEIADDTSK